MKEIAAEAPNALFLRKAIASCLESAHSPGMSENLSTTRSRRETVHFKHPFRIKGIDRLLPPGAYAVITDEEMIESLSFPCFRRVATMIMVPGAAPRNSSIEMFSIDSVDLSDAQRIDGQGAPNE
jgi:hypothetical protein